MRTYETESEQLAALETFHPKAFRGDDKCPQDVCDLVLALALIYNDFRDSMLAHSLLLEYVPKQDLNEPTPKNGFFAGAHVHFIRMHASIFRELNTLLRRNANTVGSQAFQKLVRQLPGAVRGAWDKVVAGAEANHKNDLLARFFYRTRNELGFHYDAGEIADAFATRFANPEKDPPYISRGRNMSETRFYFADAAARMHLQSIIGSSDVEQFFMGSEVLDNVNQALFEIVTRFVNARAAYRRVSTR